MDKQWGPTVQHRELYGVSWDRSWWKEYKKGMCIYIHIYIYICMYVWLGHFAVQQKLALHCKSTIIKNFLNIYNLLFKMICVVFLHFCFAFSLTSWCFLRSLTRETTSTPVLSQNLLVVRLILRHFLTLL